jgi:hypothetical protein
MDKETKDKLIDIELECIDELFLSLREGAKKAVIDAVNSGAINLDEMWNTPRYYYPKLILSIYLEKDHFSPNDKTKWNKEKKELKPFI